MTASAEWGTFEYAIIAGIPTVIGAVISGLISLSWGLFKQRLNETILRVNIHDSKIDNNRADIGRIDAEAILRVEFAAARNSEINQKLDAMRVEMRTDKQRLEDKFELLLKELSTKIDTMNDRRNQPRGP